MEGHLRDHLHVGELAGDEIEELVVVEGARLAIAAADGVTIGRHDEGRATVAKQPTKHGQQLRRLVEGA